MYFLLSHLIFIHILFLIHHYPIVFMYFFSCLSCRSEKVSRVWTSISSVCLFFSLHAATYVTSQLNKGVQPYESWFKETLHAFFSHLKKISFWCKALRVVSESGDSMQQLTPLPSLERWFEAIWKGHLELCEIKRHFQNVLPF